MTETTIEKLVALLDNEEVVSALLSQNMVDLFQKMLKKFIVCAKKKTFFYSLDHERLEPELLARYLIRLVIERIRNDEAVWPKFLDFLYRIGEKDISDKLRKMSAAVQHQSNPQANENDIILCHGDINFLVKLMATIVYKYEIVGIALNLPKHRIEECRGTNNVSNMCNILTCWISEDKHTPPSTTLSKLREALSGDLVGEYQLAIHVENLITQARKGEQKESSNKCSNYPDPLFDILEQSIDTEAEDGKSTLLYVLASPRESVCYQWHKNGQPLTNNSTYSGVDEDILVISPAVQGTEGEYTCCVSLQDKQIISNEINLKVIYSQEKKRLLDLYSLLEEVPEDSWPPVGTKTFINLILIRSEKKHNGFEEYCVSEDADKVATTKEKVEYEDIFREYESGSLIVIEGRPGSGKTTLVHKLVKDWSNGTILRNAKLVFLITLRYLNNANIESKNTFGYLEEFIMSTNDNGEGACILLDGLDEVKLDKESVIFRLLAKKCLTRAMIIVSSRPAAVKDLKQKEKTKWLQTFGFSKEQIIEYIQSFPFIGGSSKSQTNSSYSSALEKYLHNHPNVFHMCYLPVHAAMICHLYKHKGDNIPNTQTKMYEEFTLSMILRHLKRYSNETKLTSLTELSGDCKDQFDTLCKIAYTMSTKHVQVICKEELDDLPTFVGSGDAWCLGLLTVRHTLKSHGEFNEYTFVHLTFQEFLTAYFISRLTKKEQLTVIQNNASLSSTVLIFICGLLNFQVNKNLFSEIYRQIDVDLTVCLSCAFESQQKAICDEVLKQREGTLTFPANVTSHDITCVNYVTTNASELIHQINMPLNSNIILLQNIHEKHLCHVKKLKFFEVLVETKDLQTLGCILELCTQLKKIVNLTFIEIENEGAQYISEAFQTINLQYLQMTCKSSPEGIMLLLSGLKHHSQLELDLAFSELCPKGIHEVAMGLCTIPHIQLSRLRISQCEIDSNDSLMITEAIQNYHTLKLLQLDGNVVDNVFTVILSSALPQLMCLCNLKLKHQCLDDEGAVNIASGLIYLGFLEAIDLSYNNIGPQGAAAIGRVLFSMSELQILNLSHNNIGSFGTAELVDRLVFSSDGVTKLHTIDMSNNNIGSTGATMLAVGLNYFPNLEILVLSDNNICDDGAAAIGEILRSQLKLEYLNLSNNSIGLIGAERFAMGFINFPYLLRLDLSHNHIGSDGANAICSELHHLTELKSLNLSHNNIEKIYVNMKKGLSHLISLRCLNLSGNCIDLNSAIRVVQALKHCDKLWLADLSRNGPGNFTYPWISVQGIVSEEDESAITALEAAVQHRSSPRTLDFGFTSKVVEADEQ